MDSGVNTHDRDHCTPEERAVIEAALRLRQAEHAHWVESEVGNEPRRTDYERRVAYVRFCTATDSLLAARAKTEEKTSSEQ